MEGPCHLLHRRCRALLRMDASMHPKLLLPPTLPPLLLLPPRRRPNGTSFEFFPQSIRKYTISFTFANLSTLLSALGGAYTIHRRTDRGSRCLLQPSVTSSLSWYDFSLLRTNPWTLTLTLALMYVHLSTASQLTPSFSLISPDATPR